MHITGSEDSSDEDGGVLLPRTEFDTDSSIRISALKDAVQEPRIDSSYLQDSAVTASASQYSSLWTPPPLETGKGDKNLHAQAPRFNDPNVDSASIVYHRACAELRQRWKCGPAEALPSRFRASTPYSLALLFKLRSLASRVKSHRALVEEALVEQWHSRVSQRFGIEELTSTKRIFITTAVPKDFGKAGNPLQVCESYITENVYGLCLEDAIKADRALREKRKIGRRVRREEAMPATVTDYEINQAVEDNEAVDREAASTDEG